jgi:hypothetical protein
MEHRCRQGVSNGTSVSLRSRPAADTALLGFWLQRVSFE